MQSALSAAPTVENTAAALAQLEAENEKLRAQLESRNRRIRLLEEALRVLKASHFGASREKLTEAVGQGGLFNEAEVLAEISELAGAAIPLSATPLREVKHPSTEKAGRRALASHLPRVNVIHDVPETERICACGTALSEIGAEVSEQLDYQPAKVQVLRHIRKKYACRGCQQGVKTAALPAQILPRTNASPGVLAHLVTAKYVDALPLHRQEVIFARHGVSLPRATLPLPCRDRPKTKPSACCCWPTSTPSSSTSATRTDALPPAQSFSASELWRIGRGRSGATTSQSRRRNSHVGSSRSRSAPEQFASVLEPRRATCGSSSRMHSPDTCQ